jgi:hypothetical protein
VVAAFASPRSAIEAAVDAAAGALAQWTLAIAVVTLLASVLMPLMVK